MSEQQQARPRRKVRIGTVVSDKMAKSVVVELTRQIAHPLYGKRIKRTKRVTAHDDKGAAVGDTVRIVETRPMSKTKRWRVAEVVVRAE
ncbi:MAG: 30S ribosomal protein S17 [Gemmatimonadales bacterium]|jgi:small subunit ribosomal protein S17